MELNFRSISAFKLTDLHLLERENNLGSDVLNRLNISQETAFSQIQMKFESEKKYDPDLNTLNSEDKLDYYSQVFGQEDLVISGLIRQQRYGIVLSIYSFFEGRLQSTCKVLDEKFTLNRKLEDIKIKDKLRKYFIFIMQTFEANTEHVNIHFKTMMDYKIIRNIIAHQNGFANIKEVKIIKNLKNVRINNDNQIEIEADLIDHLLKCIKFFLVSLLLAIDKQYIKMV